MSLGSAVRRYARGGVVPGSEAAQKKESFRETADAIWERQKQALAARPDGVSPPPRHPSPSDG
jgi:hypothetical protein